MARFCGVYSPREPGLMRRQDVAAMLGALLRHTPQHETTFFDDDAGFGLAALSHASSPEPDWTETPTDIATFSGWITSGPYTQEERGTAAAARLIEQQTQGRSLEELAGSFAAVIWAKERHELLLATDPLGRWPLFTFHDEASGVVLFASEPKCILAHPLARRHIDAQGLGLYLFESVVPAPFTVYQGMDRLYFGEVRHIASDGRVSSEMPWQYSEPSLEERDLDGWSREVSSRFVAGLQQMTRGHEKVGVLFSAGIDSSLIFGLLKTYCPDVDVVPITGYYPPSPRHKYTNMDLPFARRLAEHWGQELVEVELSLPLLADKMEPVLRQTDQPFLNIGNQTALLAMTDAADAHGASLVLTGQGAEENFGMMGWQSVLDAQAEGQLTTLEEIIRHHSQPEQFSAERIGKLMLTPPADVEADFAAAYQGLLDKVQSSDPYDIALYAVRQVLRREHINLLSNHTMAIWPGYLADFFFHWPTVSYAAQIPSQFKGSVDLSMQRALLLHQHRDLIPQFVFERAKRGLPGFEFNNGDFPHLEARLLSRELVESQGVFHPDYFEKVLSKKKLKKSLLLAQIWLDVHVFRTEETFNLIEADRQASLAQHD